MSLTAYEATVYVFFEEYIPLWMIEDTAVAVLRSNVPLCTKDSLLVTFRLRTRSLHLRMAIDLSIDSTVGSFVVGNPSGLYTLVRSFY